MSSRGEGSSPPSAAAVGANIERLARVKEAVHVLGYDSEMVDTRAMPLVEQLCEDLVRATETFQQAQGRVREVETEVARAKAAIEPLRVENARLVGENNALHLRAIQEAEGFDERERALEGRMRVLEQNKAELEFVHETLRGRVVEQEAELARMRAKMEESLRLDEAAHQEARSDQSVRLHVSEPLRARTAVGRPAATGAEREEGLEGQVRRLAAALKEAREARDAMAEDNARLAGKVEAREREVVRLGNLLEAEGQSLERLTAEYASRAASEAVEELRRENAVLVANVAEADRDRKGSDKWKREAEALRAEADVLRDKLIAEEQKVAGLVKKVRNLHLEVAAADQQGVGELVAKIRGMGPGNPALQRTIDDIGEYFGATRKLAEGVNDLARDADAHAADRLATPRSRGEVGGGGGGGSGGPGGGQGGSGGGEGEAKLREEIKILRSDLKKARELKGFVEDEMFAVKQELTALDAEVKKASAEQKRLENLLEVTEGDRTALRKESKSASIKAARAETQRREAVAGCDAAKAKLRTLTVEFNEERKKADALELTATQLRVEVGRLQSGLDLVKAERSSLSKELQQKLAEVGGLQSSVAAAERAKDRMASLVSKIESLQAQVRGLLEEKAEKQNAAEELEAALARAKEDAKRAVDIAGKLRSRNEELVRDKDALAEATLEADRAKIDAQAQVVALGGERDRALHRVRNLLTEVAQLRDNLEAERLRVSDKEREAKKAQSAAAEARNNARLLAEEREVANLKFYESVRDVDLHKGSEAEKDALIEGLRDQLAVLQRSYNAVVEEAMSEEIREKGRKEKGDISRAEVARISEVLGERDVEILRLKSLVAQLDAQREEMGSKIRILSAQLKSCEESVENESKKRGQSERELAELRDSKIPELTDVIERQRKALRVIDRARDEAASEVKRREQQAEEILAEKGEVEKVADKFHADLAEVEAKLRVAKDALASRDRDCALLQTELDRLSRERGDMQAALEGKVGELRGAHDDLRTMTREQQRTQAELAALKTSLVSYQGAAKEATKRADHAEAMCRAKDKELEDLLRAYQMLNDDSKRVAMELNAAGRDIDRLRDDCSATEEKYRLEADRARGYEDEARQQALDLASYERNMESQQRQMAAQKARIDVLQSEGKTLNDQISAQRRATREVEKQRDNAQREAARMSSEVRAMAARLEESAADAEVLAQRVRVEQQKASDLESLLDVTRRQAFEAEALEGQERSTVFALRDRVSLLEEQNVLLEGQVEMLKRNREQQEAEQRRLTAQVLDLRNNVTEAVQRADKFETLVRNRELRERAGEAAAAPFREQDVSEMTFVRAELENTKHELSRCNAARQAAEERIKELQGVVAQKDRTLLAQSEDAVSRYNSLNQTYERLRAELLDLQAQQRGEMGTKAVMALKEQREKLEDEVKGLREEVSVSYGAIEKLRAENFALQEGTRDRTAQESRVLDQMAETKREMQGVIDAKEDEARQYHERLFAANSDLDQVRERCAALESTTKSLTEDNLRMIDLLGRMDAERTSLVQDKEMLAADLADAKDALNRQVALAGTTLRQAEFEHAQRSAAYALSADEDSPERLMQRLAESEAARMSAEAELMRTSHGTARSAFTGGSLEAEEVARLLEENAALRSNLAETERAMEEVQHDLGRVRDEYEAVRTTLTHYEEVVADELDTNV